MALEIIFQERPEPIELHRATEVMDRVGAQWVREAQGILDENDKNATGNLRSSIKYELDASDNKLIIGLNFEGAPHWEYVEEGVKGLISDAKAPNSPFQFGSGSGPAGGLRPSIRQWIDDKPVSQWQDRRTGRFLSYDQMAGLISRSVYLYGIRPTFYVGDPAERLAAMSSEEIRDAFVADLEEYWENELTQEVTIKMI